MHLSPSTPRSRSRDVSPLTRTVQTPGRPSVTEVTDSPSLLMRASTYSRSPAPTVRLPRAEVPSPSHAPSNHGLTLSPAASGICNGAGMSVRQRYTFRALLLRDGPEEHTVPASSISLVVTTLRSVLPL